MKRDKRDTDAEFDAMMLRQRDMLWSICAHFSLSPAWTSEDALQQVLVELWGAFKDYDGQCSERTWVYVVANRALMQLKRRSANRQQVQADDGSGLPEAFYDPSAEAELWQMVDSLGQPDSTILHFSIEGYSYAEIASMTGLNVGTVAMRLQRARRKLRNLIIT